MAEDKEILETAIVSPHSAWELFFSFSWISLQSFGGALTHIERTVVRDKRWLAPREFLDLYAVSQVLPGPTGISFCVQLGDRFFGARGALATVAGFMLVPSVLVVGIASVFLQYQQVPQVQGALHGMGAASAGLIVSTAARMAGNLRGQRLGIAVAALSFIASSGFSMPVGTIVLTLGVVSVWLAWRGGSA